MKLIKKIFKWTLYFLLIPVIYIILSMICSSITIDRKIDKSPHDISIYLSTNGVHLDIVLPKRHTDSLLIAGLRHGASAQYLSFGWGDENFYINTPTWSDLTFQNAFGAMFLKSKTLMHVTRYNQVQPDWVEVKVSTLELNKLNDYLLSSFETKGNGMKLILPNKGYSLVDDFYKARGSYSCFMTCNSWVNKGLKESGLKSCLWTPFDFGLLNKYK